MNAYRLLICLTFLFTGSVSGFADDFIVENVRFNTINNSVYIYYDLSGNLNDLYDISLKLSHDGGESWEIIPVALKGDIGREIAPGRNLKIEWNYLVDFPAGLTGNAYVFEVEAILHQYTPNWHIFTLGLVAGAAVLYFSQERAPRKSTLGTIHFTIPATTIY